MSGPKQSLEELGKSVKLPQYSTKKVIEMLKHDMLIALWRKNPDDVTGMNEEAKREKALFARQLNSKVAQLYEEKTGNKFKPEEHAKNKPLSLMLMGPPGQGKTAAYIVAAKAVCEDLGLNFVEHVTDDYVPRQEDFIFVSQECAGENSAITFGGIPRAEETIRPDGTKDVSLKKALNHRFKVFNDVAGGVLLFDDVANAAQPIQNVLLPVAQFHTFQGLAIKNACIGFTGNLGALDGTYTTELSSALRTRVIPLYVTDSPKDFIGRGYAYYNDSLGDLGFLNFIARNEKKFSALPEPGAKSGFACSRSWDNAIQAARSAVSRHGGRGKGEEDALFEIHAIVSACLGPELGHELISYFNSFLKGADPLAKAFIKDKEDRLQDNIKKLNEKYGGGTKSDDISFGYQFATACGDYAVNAIAESKDPNKALIEYTKRFGEAVLLLNDSEFTYSIEHYKNKLATYITDFSSPGKDSRDLRQEIREVVAKTINDLDGCDKSKRASLISVISDYDKIASASVLDSKRGARKSLT